MRATTTARPKISHDVKGFCLEPPNRKPTLQALSLRPCLRYPQTRNPEALKTLFCSMLSKHGAWAFGILKPKQTSLQHVSFTDSFQMDLAKGTLPLTPTKEHMLLT